MAGNGAGSHTTGAVRPEPVAHGFGQPDDKVKARGPASEGMDAMQIELSNFQPLAANEAIEQEVPDLGGAEQLSAADDRRK